MDPTVTLYMPIGCDEFRLIRESGWTRFPPGQSAFCPVTQEEYARRIAGGWSAKAGGVVGYVIRFQVKAGWLARYEVQNAGEQYRTEYRIPVEHLDDLNVNIVGSIDVLAEYDADEWNVVYNLATDQETIAGVQRATLTTKDFGVVPEVALFGSKEWWGAIEDGRIHRYEARGTISRLYMTGHGDWPEFELTSDGNKSQWTRMGLQTRYAEGNEARVEYVVVRLKKSLQGREHHKQVLRILIKSPAHRASG